MAGPKKELGQHWLRDPEILAEIAEAAELGKDDVVLEIGPGLGTLTSRLLARAGRVVAVEFDRDLVRKLPGQFPGKNLEVINEERHVHIHETQFLLLSRAVASAFL